MYMIVHVCARVKRACMHGTYVYAAWIFTYFMIATNTQRPNISHVIHDLACKKMANVFRRQMAFNLLQGRFCTGVDTTTYAASKMEMCNKPEINFKNALTEMYFACLLIAWCWLEWFPIQNVYTMLDTGQRVGLYPRRTQHPDQRVGLPPSHQAPRYHARHGAAGRATPVAPSTPIPLFISGSILRATPVGPSTPIPLFILSEHIQRTSNSMWRSPMNQTTNYEFGNVW